MAGIRDDKDALQARSGIPFDLVYTIGPDDSAPAKGRCRWCRAKLPSGFEKYCSRGCAEMGECDGGPVPIGSS